jgi:fused signal recognition particle receptor
MLARPPPGGGIGSQLRAVLGLAPTMDAAAWEAVEEALIAADLGPVLAADVVAAARTRLGASASGLDAVRAVLRERLSTAGAVPFVLGAPPNVILMVGVNGSGKTTSAAKLAARFRNEGRRVLLAAADTYRPGAIEQLRLWGDRVGVAVVAQRGGADPAAVAHDAAAAAVARDIEVVIVDTAGRLQTSHDLMAELAKIRRVITGQLPEQPRHVLLVLDATTGQNGLSQAQSFLADAGVTGIVLAKLDGTAKGGVAVAITDRYRIPIVFTGYGEDLDTLAPFDPDAYLDWLLA